MKSGAGEEERQSREFYYSEDGGDGVWYIVG